MNPTMIIALVIASLCGGLALFVLVRQAKSVAHLSFVAGMLALALERIFSALAVNTASVEQMTRWYSYRLGAMAFLPGTWILFSLCYARGNYREFLRRWRWVVVVAFAVPLTLVAFFQGSLIIRQEVSTLTHAPMLVLGSAGVLLNLVFLLGAVVVLMNLERTFRTSVGTMRWRIKFMILGLSLLFIFRLYTSSQALLYSAVDLGLEGLRSSTLGLACILMSVSLLREKVFSVEVYPSHAMLYQSLTVLLTGIYLIVVGVLAQVVTWLGGDAALPLKALLVLLALVILTVLLLSERLRQRLKRFVSHHFQRPLYDYRQVWTTFTERTTSVVDEIKLCRTVASWVSETFHALSVTVWLVDEKRERLVFVSSTSLPESTAKDLAEEGADIAPLVRAMRDRPFPIDIDDSKEEWVEALQRQNPDYFPGKGGNRVCLPLVARGELLALIAVGDRVSGVPFSVEDLDLLKCVGDQMAANLLGIQLSKRLLQAKEMEAFQTMSAFFVHDLKNTASTLSLMLQNFQVHFEDPAFRAEALRAADKSVNHINDLIGRLSLLRQELKMVPIQADLNEVVNTALATLPGVATPSLTKSLEPVPALRLDPEQIQKVIINLVLNARDAIRPTGQIRIETGRRNGWAVLSVADDGCGMTRDFLRQSLFRPFQTTKKKGIGIGMFHSKMIVDAHLGRIEVESEPGKGTTVRVLLPIQA